MKGTGILDFVFDKREWRNITRTIKCWRNSTIVSFELSSSQVNSNSNKNKNKNRKTKNKKDSQKKKRWRKKKKEMINNNGHLYMMTSLCWETGQFGCGWCVFLSPVWLFLFVCVGVYYELMWREMFSFKTKWMKRERLKLSGSVPTCSVLVLFFHHHKPILHICFVLYCFKEIIIIIKSIVTKKEWWTKKMARFVFRAISTTKVVFLHKHISHCPYIPMTIRENTVHLIHSPHIFTFSFLIIPIEQSK